MVRCRRARNEERELCCFARVPERGLVLVAVLLSVLVLACDEGESAQPLSAPSFATFVSDAYPVLLRDCGFPACHGDTRRFFQVYGPGRLRLSPTTLPYDAPTADELQQSYDRARSMLSGAEFDRLLLLRKPLAVAAGGAGHAGDDPWQQPVYPQATEPGFVVLRAWALADPSASPSDAGAP